MKCEKLKRFFFTMNDNDRNRLSRKIENSNDVELKLKNRNLKLTKLFLYEIIVESNRFITCFNLTNEICHSNEYDDKKNETNLIFFWIDLITVERNLLIIINWIDFLIEKKNCENCFRFVNNSKIEKLK